MTIWRPVAVEALCLSWELVHILTFSLPESKVTVGAGGETLQDWIEAKCLNFGIVSVFEEAYAFSGPHHNVVVSTSRSPALTVLRVGERIYHTLVGTFRVQYFSVEGVIDEDSVTNGDEDFFTIYRSFEKEVKFEFRSA